MDEDLTEAELRVRVAAARQVLDDPLQAAEDRLAAHAECGWLLGQLCASADEPDGRLLSEALTHLETAVVIGVDDLITDDPELMELLGTLLLRVPDEDPGTVAEAREVLREALACADLDPELRLRLLARIAEAARRRVALALGDGGGGRPSEDLADVRDELVDAWDAVFTAMEPGDERAVMASAELGLALAERILAGSGQPDDVSTLLRLVQRQPHMPVCDGDVVRATTTVLFVTQVLATAFERDGREALLAAMARLLDDARGWAGLPPELAPLLDAMLASAIVNAPDGSALAARLEDASDLLEAALGALPADDPHVAQLLTQRALLVQRLAAGGAQAGLSTAATDLAHAADLLAVDQRDHAVLAGTLAGVLGARFQQRRDLRDVRAGLRMIEEALVGFTGTALQHAVLLGNRCIHLLRIAAVDMQPGILDRALAAVRAAIAVAPPVAALRAQLLAVQATVLMAQGGQTQDPALRLEKLVEARGCLRPATPGVAPPHPFAAALEVGIDALLTELGTPSDGAGAFPPPSRSQLREQLTRAGQSTAALDLIMSLVVAADARRGTADPVTLDEALARLDALHAPFGDDEAHPMWGMLALARARLQRVRDNLSWSRSLEYFLDSPLTDGVDRARLRHWLDQGGSALSQISDLLTGAAVAQIRDREDRRLSRALGLRALRGHALRVLLQSGTRDAIATARAAAADANEVATWCLSDGADEEAIAALETGRALTLLAASTASSVAARLDALGERELGALWRRGVPAEGDADAGPADVPDDVRHRVLDRLGAAGELTRLLQTPDLDKIAATLRELRYDALVYLVPGARGSGTDGRPRPLLASAAGGRSGGALIVSAAGRTRWVELPDLSVGPDGMLARYLAAHHARLGGAAEPAELDSWRRSLAELCQWAWDAAIGPLEPSLASIHSDRRARVVLVPVDALSVVPWHAACPAGNRAAVAGDLAAAGERRYGLDSVVFSYAASAALLCLAAKRPRPPLDASVLLVGDPGGDLPFAQAETQALRHSLYPAATLWGEPPELTDAPATPARLRAALTGSRCSLFHYAGHAVIDPGHPGSSALVLGGQRLRADSIIRLRSETGLGYCVCLAACTTHLTTQAFDEAFTLATAFLVGGASTVMGSLWRVQDAGTTILMFMVHHHLAAGMRPVDALHRAQLWMINPRRRVPPSMPAELREQIGHLDLADPVMWAGMTHQGC